MEKNSVFLPEWFAMMISQFTSQQRDFYSKDQTFLEWLRLSDSFSPRVIHVSVLCTRNASI